MSNKNLHVPFVLGLRPDTEYVVLVSAVNGVSNLSMEDPMLNAAQSKPIGKHKLANFIESHC